MEKHDSEKSVYVKMNSITRLIPKPAVSAAYYKFIFKRLSFINNKNSPLLCFYFPHTRTKQRLLITHLSQVNSRRHYSKTSQTKRRFSKPESISNVRHFHIFPAFIVAAHLKDKIFLLFIKLHFTHRLRHLGQRHWHAFSQFARRGKR